METFEQQGLTWRPWRESDVDKLAQLEQKANPYPWRHQHFHDSMTAGHAGWVMCDHNDAPISFMILQLIVDEMHLLNIAVDEAYRRRGLATKMLTWLTTYATQRQARIVLLEVRRSNTAAQQLYQNVGFNEMSIRYDYYSSQQGREDAILMALDLSFNAFTATQG